MRDAFVSPLTREDLEILRQVSDAFAKMGGNNADIFRSIESKIRDTFRIDLAKTCDMGYEFTEDGDIA